MAVGNLSTMEAVLETISFYIPKIEEEVKLKAGEGEGFNFAFQFWLKPNCHEHLI